MEILESDQEIEECDKKSGNHIGLHMETCTFVNLTSDIIKIADMNGRILSTIYPSGDSVYIRFQHRQTKGIVVSNEIVPIVCSEIVDVAGLPPPKKGVFYIVSPKNKAYISQDREDVLAPDMGKLSYREPNGDVVVRQFRYIGR